MSWKQLKQIVYWTIAFGLFLLAILVMVLVIDFVGKVNFANFDSAQEIFRYLAEKLSGH